MKKKVANLLVTFFTLIATVAVTSASYVVWHQPEVPKELLKK
jgi:Staphylococcal AgrD protein.